MRCVYQTSGGVGMMVMPSNHSSALIHYLAGKHPNRIGWLIGPTGLAKTKLRDWMPFACDNDAFSAWANEKEWDYLAWIGMLKKNNQLKTIASVGFGS